MSDSSRPSSSAGPLPGDSPSAHPNGPGGVDFVGPPAPYGPMPTSPRETYGPEPIQLRPAVIVLGPGWARGFAHAGVLQALEEAKIPIAGVVGTEIGALMAVLDGMSRSINDFEWALLKLKPGLFSGEGKMFSRIFKKPSDGHDLEDALEQILGAKELRESRFPVRLLVSPAAEKGVRIVDSGRAALAIRAGVAVPGLMTPGTWQDHRFFSAGRDRPFPVSEAKGIAPFPVIVIDVADRSGAEPLKLGKNPEADAYFKSIAAASRQLDGEADLVIRPDLDGFDSLDFQHRVEIAFRGKKAAQAQLDQIKHLVGMP